MIRRGSTLVFLLLFFVPTLAWAQSSARITGTVTDADTGEPLPGATVAIAGTSQGAATDADGEYTIFEVSPGTYTIEASFVGYTTVRRSGVEVIGGITRRLDFELPAGELELDAIEVTAEQELVNPTATSAIRRLGREELEDLPTRDTETFYAIQPGVTTMNDEVYIRGGRPDETGFMLEGTSSRSIVGNDNVIPVIPEALEEVQVYAGGYSAELGGANAGIIQQVLRSGGTELSAMAQYETDAPGSAFTDYTYDTHDLTLTLGGPILSNRFRFFAAGNYVTTDNYDPMFWYGAELGQPTDARDPSNVREAPDALAWEEGQLPGIGQPEERFTFNGTLTADFSPLRLRMSWAQTDRERRINSQPVFNYYNQERLPQRDDLRRLVTLRGTYFLGSTTYIEADVGRFDYNFDVYDPLFDIPEADGQGGALVDLLQYYRRSAVADAVGDDLADRYTSEWTSEYQDPENYLFNQFEFAAPGNVATSYQRRRQSYWNYDLGLVSQQGSHELRLGGNYQRWTVRSYQASAASLASRVSTLSGADSTAYIEGIASGAGSVANTLRRSGYGGYGYDVFMNEVDDGPNGAKNPVTASVYVNDRIEFEDIIVNAGLRYDHFDMDLVEPEDYAAPEYNSTTFEIANLQEAPAKGVLQPRLGLSFPATERTVFHLQYGRFAQMPDMNYAYASQGYIGLVLGGQNFIPTPFAWDLDPIVSTQYEIGIANQFTDFASIDITAFYRRTEGQVEIVRQEVDAARTAAAAYNLFTNGDFSIARGVELALRTRRVGGFLGMVNYTLTDAKGTNSSPGGQVAALEGNYAPPSLLQPLAFEQRHRGAIVLDYQTDGGNVLTDDVGINLLFTFNSGHRFTRATGPYGQRAAYEGPLLVGSDTRSRQPIEPLNASTTPWVYNLDLRLEKGFDLGRGTSATVYGYVQNVFNTRGILNVYPRTGSGVDDAFLSTPALSEAIVSGAPPEFVDYYRAINLQNRQHYIAAEGNDLFSDPTQVRLGVRLGF